MPNGTKLVKVNGKTYRVPADATPEEIDQISSADVPKVEKKQEGWGSAFAHSLGIPTSPEEVQQMLPHSLGDVARMSFNSFGQASPIAIGDNIGRSMVREGVRGAPSIGNALMFGLPVFKEDEMSPVHALSAFNPFAAPVVDRMTQLREAGKDREADATGVIGATSLALPMIKPMASGVGQLLRRPLGSMASFASDVIDPELTGIVSPRLANVQRMLGRVGSRLNDPQLDLFRNTPKLGDSPINTDFNGSRTTGNPTFDFNQPKAPPPRDFASSHEVVGHEPELLQPSRTRGTMLESGEGPKLLPEGPIQLGEPTEIQSPSVYPARKIILRDPASGRMKTMYGSDSGPTLYQGTPARTNARPAAPALPNDVDSLLNRVHGQMDEAGFPQMEGPEAGAPSFKDYGSNSPANTFPPRQTLFGGTPSRPAVNNTPFSQRTPNNPTFDLEDQLRQSVDATGDTEAWNQAKKELPTGNFSQWAQRAQEIKTNKSPRIPDIF